MSDDQRRPCRVQVLRQVRCEGGTGMTRREDLVRGSPCSSSSRDEEPEDQSSDKVAICGWVTASILGTIASIFLIIIYFFPSKGIFPVRVQLYVKPDKPIFRQGNLRIYPGINTSTYAHTISLNPIDAIQNSHEIYEVVQEYPTHNANEPPPSPYVHCCFKNPSKDQPCFFDRDWLGDLCTMEDGYGYDDSSPYINPCFLIRLENTGAWMPEQLNPEFWGDSKETEHDPAFLGFTCRPKEEDKSGVTFERRPLKGFSVHFFPMTNFAPDLYLPPAVMVQVKRVPRKVNVTIECWIRTHNKYFLTDNGYMVISFKDKKPGRIRPPPGEVSGPSTRSGYMKTPRLIDQSVEVPSTTFAATPTTMDNSPNSTVATANTTSSVAGTTNPTANATKGSENTTAGEDEHTTL